MKKTLEILKILFIIFIIIELHIAVVSVLVGVISGIGSEFNIFGAILFCFFVANGFICEILSQIIVLFYKGLILYPLTYFKVFIIIFFT
ncbi:hypothetical protein, partial [Campylobacter canadensis]